MMPKITVVIQETTVNGGIDRAFYVSNEEATQGQICNNIAEVHAHIDRMIVRAALRGQKALAS